MTSQLDDVVDLFSSPTAIGRSADELMEEVAKRWPTVTDFQVQRAAQLAAARLRTQAARDSREAAQLRNSGLRRIGQQSPVQRD